MDYHESRSFISLPTKITTKLLNQVLSVSVYHAQLTHYARIVRVILEHMMICGNDRMHAYVAEPRAKLKYVSSLHHERSNIANRCANFVAYYDSIIIFNSVICKFRKKKKKKKSCTYVNRKYEIEIQIHDCGVKYSKYSRSSAEPKFLEN